MESVNSLALQFNKALKAKMKELNSRLPDADFTVADIYWIVLDLIKNPETYGNKTTTPKQPSIYNIQVNGNRVL